MQLELAVKERVDNWLNGAYDQESKNLVQNMLDNKEYEALTDAFYKDLEFGTGGLRGVMGPGTNRVNKYTIGIATQGFSNYLRKKYSGEISVCIAHDSRNNHKLFAETCANVFSANGIKVYFFEGLRPTPELSYAVRKLKCQGGVVLTASHNPREYNGYKAYGSDGGQLVSPDDKAVLSEVRAVQSIDEVKFSGDSSLIHMIGEEMDEMYLNDLKELSINPDAIRAQKDLKIVFSAIHGSGGVSVPPVLKKFGFENVIEVKEQTTYDGNFPTVVYPNPEEEEAMSMALAKAKEEDADLIVATDPDADRVGIGAKNHHGDFVLINGNQTGSLLMYYVLTALDEQGQLDDSKYVVKTIVTSYLLDKIAKSKNVICYNTLTGFKHIGALMTKLDGQKKFVVGGEESYGYLVGDLVRDKDAVVSAAMIAEMTAYYKNKGWSMFDALMEMYLEFGFYKEKLVYIVKKGQKGAQEIADMMHRFRNNPPTSLGGQKVVEIRDYLESKGTRIESGEEYSIDLPKSNVLQFVTADDSIVSVRPSGTEPKIKFYCSVNEPLESKSDFDRIDEKLDQKLAVMIDDLKK